MSGNPRVPRLDPVDMAKLSELAYLMAHNEKTRDYFAHMARVVSPEDAKAFQDVFMKQEIGKLRKEIQDERLKEKMEKAATAREDQKRAVQKRRGFSNEQMAAIEKIQQQYNFGDWEAAADIYAQRNPPENPALKPPPNVTSMGSTWDMPTFFNPEGKEIAFKDYVKNPRKHANDLAIHMIHDFLGKKPNPAFNPGYAR